MDIKALVFDLGGVYFQNGTKKVMELLENSYGVEKDILEDIYYGKGSFNLRNGIISSKDHWKIMYAKYPELASIDFRRIWYESFTVNEDAASTQRDSDRGDYNIIVDK